MSKRAEAIYLEAWAEGWKPDPDLTVSQWADEYRYLPKKASAEPGRWRTSRTPYLREIMDSLSPRSKVERVVFMKGAQIGGTEIGFNWLGFIIHHCPGPALMVQPTVEIAKRVSKQRLAPSIEDTPVLRERVAESRSRDSGNTMFVKEFPGGLLILTGANSAVGLRSMPIRFLFLDEVDGYPGDVDGEGDPVSLAEKRTNTFSRKKIFMVSTPNIKGISRIESEYLASDQRKYFVPCPHCENYDWIRWHNIQWEEGRPETARLLCESCGSLIEERHKTNMLSQGQWRAAGEGALTGRVAVKRPDGKWGLTVCDGKTRGYHLSSLYSPLGWRSWADIVREFLSSKNDQSKLKTWVNTVLGETWEEDQGETVDDNVLFARREDWGKEIPPDAGVLTCGIDVQGNRIEAEVVAWGRGKESWSIEYRTFYGDPRRPSVWIDLDTFLQKTYTHTVGVELPIACACVDTGDNTQHVYDFVRPRQTRRVYGVKGANQAGLPVVNRPTTRNKGGILLFTLGVDTAKADIYSYMKIIDPGPGYMHFPMSYDKEYFEQLTAEKVVTRFHKGFPKREWVKTRARNEALDCRVYALAALHILNPAWDGIFENLGKKALSKKAPLIPENQGAMRPQPSRKKSWINGWRR